MMICGRGSLSKMSRAPTKNTFEETLVPCLGIDVYLC